MRKFRFVSKGLFLELYDCDNMPEMNESKCCMYCDNMETLHVGGSSKFSSKKHCCSKYMFELCMTNAWKMRCDDFEKKE